jgi:uncharacterized protein (DUF433 family)
MSRGLPEGCHSSWGPSWGAWGHGTPVRSKERKGIPWTNLKGAWPSGITPERLGGAVARAVSDPQVTDWIAFKPGVQSGTATFAQTRLPVSLVLEYLSDDLSMRGVLKQFPMITKEHVKSALRLASHLARL